MRSSNQDSSGASPSRLHFLFLVDTPLLPLIFNLQNMKTYVAEIPISKMLWFFSSSLSLYDIGAELPYIWSHTCLQTCLAAILISSTGICILASPLTSCPTPCFTSILNWKVATSCVTLCGHALLAQTFYLNKDANSEAPYLLERSDSLHSYSAVIYELVRHLNAKSSTTHKFATYLDNNQSQSGTVPTRSLIPFLLPGSTTILETAREWERGKILPREKKTYQNPLLWNSKEHYRKFTCWLDL